MWSRLDRGLIDHSFMKEGCRDGVRERGKLMVGERVASQPLGGFTRQSTRASCTQPPKLPELPKHYKQNVINYNDL